MSFTKLDYYQYLLTSRVNYTLTYLANQEYSVHWKVAEFHPPAPGKLGPRDLGNNDKRTVTRTGTARVGHSQWTRSRTHWNYCLKLGG